MRRAPRYVHGPAGTPQGVRVPEIMHNFDAVALNNCGGNLCCCIIFCTFAAVTMDYIQ